MALYEFLCEKCRHRFEQISNFSEIDQVSCPNCATPKSRKLISSFRVAGRGDLRESTFHGCHDHQVTGPNHDHPDHGSGESES